MSTTTKEPRTAASPPPQRRPGELQARELGRWLWRQIVSMRTALVLLLLLALAAVPGSVIPQSGVDALAVTRWKDQHPQLTPIYERLDLFSVYDSVWFSAIYILLMLSLVGCILPRTFHYVRAARAQPPAAPRNLTRLPDHATYRTHESAEVVLERAHAVLRKRRYRLRRADAAAGDAVSGERGYLREVGNLLFHVSVLIVLVGFAIGGLLGYQGGVILVKGTTFANGTTQYDDLAPGSLFGADDFDPFNLKVDDFDVTWLQSGPGKGTARDFRADLTYQDRPGAPEQEYPLRVNHPLTIDNTDVFLIGHGYAPDITIRDGNGDVAYSGPTIFLPQDQSFLSFGVVPGYSALPTQVGLEGNFYPYFALLDGDPITVSGEDKNPLLSLNVYAGDLGVDDGSPQSVYTLDKDNATQLQAADGSQPYRLDLAPGDTQQLPDGLGSVTFNDVQPWVRLQISQSPGKGIALAGVILALIGLLGSLFIRPRRVWVRAREDESGTLVEIGLLDRSGGSDMTDVLVGLEADLKDLSHTETSTETGTESSNEESTR